MVALLLALKQVLQGHHFSVMQDKKVALAKIIHAEIIQKNVKGPPMFQELVADTFWKKPLM